MSDDAPSLLASRALTADERAAHDEEPRPGVDGDGAALRQDETDLRIRRELFTRARRDERDALVEIMGRDSVAGFATGAVQRGGLDSDPMVRLLAYRAWGDRDRAWRGERGVKAGEEVTLTFETLPSERVGLAWPNERALGVARSSGFPGQEIEVRIYDRPDLRYNDWPVDVIAARGELHNGDLIGILRVSERPRAALPPHRADVVSHARYPDEPVAPVWTSAERIEALHAECVAIVARARASAGDGVDAMDEALRAIERLGGGDRWRTVRLLARVLAVHEHALWLAFLAYEQREGLRRRVRVLGRPPPLPPRESYASVLAAFGVELPAPPAPVPRARPAPACERGPTLPMPTVAQRAGSIVDAMVAEARVEAAQAPVTAHAAEAEPDIISLRPPSLVQRLRSWLRRDS